METTIVYSGNSIKFKANNMYAKPQEPQADMSASNGSRHKQGYPNIYPT